VCENGCYVCAYVGSVFVSYYNHHAGHERELAHVPLRQEQRQQLASKLAAGIPFDDVLDSVHVTASPAQISNLQLLRKKDLQNIARDFGIDRGEVLHRNDAESVAAWVHKTRMDKQTENLVLCQVPG